MKKNIFTLIKNNKKKAYELNMRKWKWTWIEYVLIACFVVYEH